MSTAEITSAPTEWKLPSQRKVGMICLITTESALFSIFVVAYLFYLGKNLNGPYPHQILHFPWLASAALFGSSFTVMIAEKAMHHRKWGQFFFWWAFTMVLGTYFIYFTGTEWAHLIKHEHLTLQTNVFGSTFYALVGLHASHVIIGLLLLGIVFVAGLRGKIHPDHFEHVEMVSWYWHFVDAIWVVVLLVVYIIGVQNWQ